MIIQCAFETSSFFEKNGVLSGFYKTMYALEKSAGNVGVVKEILQKSVAGEVTN